MAHPTHPQKDKPWESSKDAEKEKKDEGPPPPPPLTSDQARTMQRQYASSGPRNPDAVRLKALEFIDAILDNIKESDVRTAAFEKIDEIVEQLRSRSVPKP